MLNRGVERQLNDGWEGLGGDRLDSIHHMYGNVYN